MTPTSWRATGEPADRAQGCLNAADSLSQTVRDMRALGEVADTDAGRRRMAAYAEIAEAGVRHFHAMAEAYRRVAAGKPPFAPGPAVPR